MLDTHKNRFGETIVTNLPDDIITKKHGGHSLRTNRVIVDRKKIGLDSNQDAQKEKQPNTYSGHTYKNSDKEKYRLDGHKMTHHMDRIVEWQQGKRIAPIHIDMGLTKFCNTACIYCIGVTQGMVKGTMIKPEALLRFIDDCGRLKVRSLAFIGDGEPTLNPAMYDAVVRGGEVGVDIGISTNGLLIDLDRAHDLLSNATFLRFNLSSAEPENFLKVLQSKAEGFNHLVQIMKSLVQIKKENSYKCTLGIQMVLIPENFDQVVKLAKLGAEIGVDYLQVKQCSDTEYKEIGINYEDYEKVQNALKEAEKYSTDDYLVKIKWNKINLNNETEIYKDGFRKYDVCFGTPFLGQISGNGKVYPCGPYFGKDRFLMGDIHKESYYDIVMSDRYWDVHQDIKENVDVHHDCTVGCRQDYINKFLYDMHQTPEHVNFI